MSALVLVSLALVVLMARRLVDIYFGGGYVCPACGARGERQHSPDCPWSRPGSN